MKILIAFLLAILAAVGGILYLAPLASNFVQSAQTYSSPDEAMNMHNIIYLLTAFLAMALGWSIGLIIGGAIEDAVAGPKD